MAPSERNPSGSIQLPGARLRSLPRPHIWSLHFHLVMPQNCHTAACYDPRSSAAAGGGCGGRLSCCRLPSARQLMEASAATCSGRIDDSDTRLYSSFFSPKFLRPTARIAISGSMTQRLPSVICCHFGTICDAHAERTLKAPVKDSF